ncbi:hypothetical protein [Sinomonas atrocyanea]
MDVAPPTPSICRASPEPSAFSSSVSRASGAASTASAAKIQHLLVPPRTHAAATSTVPFSSSTGVLLQALGLFLTSSWDRRWIRTS